MPYLCGMSDTFRTIHSPSEGLYKEKGSKFLAFAFPVHNEEQVQAQLTVLRKKYFDARHHCYAWRLGATAQRHRSNDDGEPSGSAGLPILGQLRAFELTNILVVVVRYFGGVKLGVGGLVQAYKAATAHALQQASIVERTLDDELQLSFDYLAMNDVMRLVKDLGLETLDAQYELRCALRLRTRQGLVPELLARLAKIEGLHIDQHLVGQ